MREKTVYASVDAVMAVIKRHKVPVIDGHYHITDEMISEAVALDAAHKWPPRRWMVTIAFTTPKLQIN